MAAHLTISLELITFMKWVLEHKQEAFAHFIEASLAPELRNLLLYADNSADVSSEDLYETVNNFLGFIEHSMAQTLSDAPAQPATVSGTLDGKELYRSLSAQTHAQLKQAFDKDLLAESMQHAATKLDEDAAPKSPSEQATKHVVLQSLLNKWQPGDNEVN